MRHRKAKTKFGRTAAHRDAMLSNMVSALVKNGRIKTTAGKVQAVRRAAERAITRATRLGDILTTDPAKLDDEQRARMVHAIRQVRRKIRDPQAVELIFGEWGPRFLGRPGGYTRTYRLINRKGDNAPMALLEFVPSEMPKTDRTRGRLPEPVEVEAEPEGDAEDEPKKKKRGLFKRS